MKRVVLISCIWFKLLASLPLLQDFHKAEQIAHLYEKPLAVIHKLDSLIKNKLFEIEVGNQFVFVEEEEFDCDIPILILLDKEGREITRLGYEEGSVKEFANRLKSRFAMYQTLCVEFEKKATEKELEELYQIASDLGSKYYKERIIEKGSLLQEGIFFLLEKYTSYVNRGEKDSLDAKSIKKMIQERDPGDEKGSKLRLLLIDFQDDNRAEIQEYIDLHAKEHNEVLSRLEQLLRKSSSVFGGAIKVRL